MPITQPTSAKNASGTFATNDLGDLTNVTINRPQQLEEYASSGTGGQISRVAGHQDASGQFTMLQEPTFNRGDTGNLTILYDTGENAYNGGAIIGDIQATIDIRSGNAITWQITWGQYLLSASSVGSF